MFSTSHNEKMVEVLTGAERRRRRTPQEKIAIVQQTFEPGMTVSHVARLHDVNANQLFKWRKQFQEGSLTAITAGEVTAITAGEVNRPGFSREGANKSYGTRVFTGNPLILND